MLGILKSRLKRNTATYWRCSIRNTSVTCLATVTQRGNMFTRGVNGHNHSENPEVNIKPELKVHILKRAKSEIFVPAAEIVENAMISRIENINPGLPSITNLARAANRARENLRPQDPTDLDFELDMAYTPDNFLRAGIKVDGRRHLVFATDQMLNILCPAKTWYLDGTFKIVKEPFVQLFSIHAFVKSESTVKQLPLTFVLMSGKCKKDYRRVLIEVLKALPAVPAIRRAIVDFESGLWKAIQKVYPNVNLKGCSFHWTQAVWRKIQLWGLQQRYINNSSTHNFCRKLMALPFLPSEHIETAFRNIQEVSSNSVEEELATYIGNTWITGQWQPIDWSVLNQSVGTNNDVEGWHMRINARALRGQVQLYLLIKLLHQEAKLVSLQLHLVSQNKLIRYQRKTYRKIPAAIFALDGTISVNHMLRVAPG